MVKLKHNKKIRVSSIKFSFIFALIVVISIIVDSKDIRYKEKASIFTYIKLLKTPHTCNKTKSAIIIDIKLIKFISIKIASLAL